MRGVRVVRRPRRTLVRGRANHAALDGLFQRLFNALDQQNSPSRPALSETGTCAHESSVARSACPRSGDF